MEKNNDKVLYGVMNILFNAWGVPAFMRGNSKEGVKHILLSCFTFGVCALIYEIKGIIAGVKVLQMSDEDYLADKYGAAPVAETPAE